MSNPETNQLSQQRSPKKMVEACGKTLKHVYNIFESIQTAINLPSTSRICFFVSTGFLPPRCVPKQQQTAKLRGLSPSFVRNDTAELNVLHDHKSGRYSVDNPQWQVPKNPPFGSLDALVNFLRDPKKTVLFVANYQGKHIEDFEDRLGLVFGN